MGRTGFCILSDVGKGTLHATWRGLVVRLWLLLDQWLCDNAPLDGKYAAG